MEKLVRVALEQNDESFPVSVGKYEWVFTYESTFFVKIPQFLKAKVKAYGIRYIFVDIGS